MYNGFGFIFALLIGAVYMAPTLIAASKKHPKLGWILLFNLFFGWSLIGWIYALYRASKGE